MRRGPPPKERATTALRRTLRASALPSDTEPALGPGVAHVAMARHPYGFIRVRGQGIYVRWLCMVSRGWVWLFLSGGTMANGMHAVMVAHGVPAYILAQAGTTN